MNTKEFFQQQVQQLSSLMYPKEEAKHLVFWLLEHHHGISRKDLLMDRKLLKDTTPILESINALLEGKPIQYIIGKAPFYGREFIVDERVLIPRRETEELVYWICENHKDQAPSLLDIGTGSGCIPITIKLELPRAKVSGVDISEEALSVARQNADRLNAEVTFFFADALNWNLDLSTEVSVLVSNPPYVRVGEKSQMKTQVLDHEPGLALFVDDADPLVFYRAIANIGVEILKPNGLLYFEINEAFGSPIKVLLEELGYGDVKVRKDMQGRDRMVRATNIKRRDL